jgi:hypothetical protein
VDVFILTRGEVGKMDMESDMSDGDMGMLGIFRPIIIIYPPLTARANKIEEGGKERSRKK